jgi:hypothetical protein
MNFGSFRIQNPYFKHILMIKLKYRDLSARNQGLRRKKPGQQVDSWEAGGLFNKITRRRGIRLPRPSDLKSMAENKSYRRVRGRGRTTGRRARAVSGLGGGRADRSGPATRAQETNEQDPGVEVRWVAIS